MTNRLAVVALGSPTAPRTWSGTSAALVRALAHAGREVVPIDARADDRRLRKAAAVAALLAENPRGLPAAWSRLTAESRSDYNWLPQVVEMRAKAVQSRARAADCDTLLHLGSSTAAPGCSDDQRQYHFIDSCWATIDPPRSSRRFTQRQSRRVREMERSAFLESRHVFTTSAYVRDALVQEYELPSTAVTVAGSGFHMDPLQGAKVPADPPYALFVAKARWTEKGGDLVLDAWRELQELGLEVHLKIVGQDAYMKGLPKLQNVEYLGHVPYPQLVDLFRRASLFVLPATREPWGLVLIEALASATPVVGLDTPNFREIAGRYGFICEPEARALAALVTELLQQRQVLTELGEAARDYAVRSFSWDSVANTILNEIDRERM